MIYFEDDNTQIINDDCLTTRFIPDGTVDLIVTSPPYNLDKDYGGNKDGLIYQDYLDFSRQWICQSYKWLKSDGRLAMNIPLDTNKGGQKPVGSDIIQIAQEIGFTYQSAIVWNEGNISKRTAWGSWKSASAPYVIAPIELIVLFYKNTWKKFSGSKINDIERDEFIAWTNGLWTFNGESAKRIGHPAPFPLELPKRVIKLFSFVGDTVLDPFMGSGTTLLAASQFNRKSIGIDIEEKYCHLSKDRYMKQALGI